MACIRRNFIETDKEEEERKEDRVPVMELLIFIQIYTLLFETSIEIT